jgi:outer membrane protein assembly factor BamB
MPLTPRPLTLRVLTLAALVFSGGCSWFSWLPWVGDDEDKDPLEPAELVKFKEEVEIDTEWRRGIGDGLGRKYMRLRPLVLADRIYAADGYGYVAAFDRYSGKKVWDKRIDRIERGMLSRLNFFDRRDRSFVGGLGTGAGMVFVGTTTGFVVALSAADGEERWRSNVQGEVLAASTAEEGLVFTQTIDGRLIALKEDSGEQVWSFSNPVPVLTLRGTSSPVYSAGAVITGFASGKVSAIRASNGEPVWEQRVMLPEGRSELERIVDVDGTPLISTGNVYVASYQGRVKALRQRDGSQIWEREISSFLDLTEGYSQVYVVAEDDVITAFDRDTGEVAWTQDGLKRRKLTPPLAFSNYLLVGDDDGYLHVLAQSDGRFIGRRKIDGEGLRSGMTVVDSTVYVLGNSGKLSAITVEEG